MACTVRILPRISRNAARSHRIYGQASRQDEREKIMNNLVDLGSSSSHVGIFGGFGVLYGVSAWSKK